MATTTERFATILERLDRAGVPSDRWPDSKGEFWARCPFHADSHPTNFSVHPEKGYRCFACGAGGKLSDLAKELGLDDLPPFSGNGSGKRREVARYDYQNAEGKVLYQVIRFQPKDFCQFNPAAGEWSIKGIERVPYRLPELLSSIKAGKVIWVVEGEKDCEALARLGLVATCNQGGIGSGRLWQGFAKKYFAARTRIMLCPDADKPGRKLMAEVGGYLTTAGGKVRVLDLGYPVQEKHGSDVSDWLAEGHSREELLELARNASPFTVDEKTPASESEAPVKDYGHAAVLAWRFRGRYRWAAHRRSWMEWSGQVWRPVEEERIAKVAADTLRAEYAGQLAMATDKATIGQLTALVRETCVYARIMGALSFLKGWDGILTRAEEWDADAWALNVDNGIIDLRSGEIAGHDPERLLTKLAPVRFEPDASGVVWRAHLERCLPDENVQRQVQRDLGLALVGADVEEMLPIWFGIGANGKTTTAKVLRRVLGDYLAEAAPGLLIQTKFERHPTELADLARRRLVFSSEVGQGKRLDEEVVKRLTGGDVKKARFMRADFFEFEQTFTIFMVVNHHPGITGTDTAIWRRVRLVPWTMKIPEAERLPQDEIVERMAAEGSAILAWLLAGLADWQRERGWAAPEVKAATAAYRLEQDRLGAFLDEACEEAAHYTVSVAGLYEAYTAWSAEAGEDPLGKTAFGRRLKERGKTTKRTGHDMVTTWFGLRLKRDLQRLATRSTVSPLENDAILDKQENNVAKRCIGEDDLATVDTETLEANAQRLTTYLDDETIPLEERHKRLGEYQTLIDEIERRALTIQRQ